MNTRLEQAIAISPFVFLLHELEEFFTVGPFVAASEPTGPIVLQELMPRVVESFGWAVLILFIVQTVAAIALLHAGGPGTAAMVFALLLMTRLVNVIFHLAHAIAARGYVPGLVTVVLVVAPFAAWLLARLVKENIVPAPALHALIIGGIVVHIVGVAVVLALAIALQSVFS